MYNISDSTIVDATDNKAIDATRFIHSVRRSNLPILPIIIIYYLLFIIYYLLFIIYYLLFIIYYLLFIIYYYYYYYIIKLFTFWTILNYIIIF